MSEVSRKWHNEILHGLHYTPQIIRLTNQERWNWWGM